MTKNEQQKTVGWIMFGGLAIVVIYLLTRPKTSVTSRVTGYNPAGLPSIPYDPSITAPNPIQQASYPQPITGSQVLPPCYDTLGPLGPNEYVNVQGQRCTRFGNGISDVCLDCGGYGTVR